MSKTKIEWASHTVNWLAGCTKVSPACTNCYAESMSARLALMGPPRYQGVTEGRRWTGAINYDAAALSRAFEGLRAAKKPRRVFVNSMSDTFHADAPPYSLIDLADAIKDIESTERIGAKHADDWKPWPHVIMLLTKRPERLRDWQRGHFPDGLPSWVWVGCTVENQERADERVPMLLHVKTDGVRYLSCEPLLGPVDLERVAPLPDGTHYGPLAGPDGPGIHWVITGGESGTKARPSHPQWFRDIRDQCEEAGVAHLFKQWGEHAPMDPPAPGGRWLNAHGDDLGPWLHNDGQWYLAPSTVMHRPGKKAAGRLLDGRTWDEFP